MKEEGRVEGQIALITGSDFGLGQATAIQFAKEGADIVVIYHTDRAGAEKTLKEVEKAGRKGIIIQADISDEKQVEQMFDKALEKFGRVDILMNNAGIDAQELRVADLSTEMWHNAFRINLDSYFFCSRRFINIKKKAGGYGWIINVTSYHEEQPRAGAAEYDCTTGAVKIFTRTLALELAEYKINVNSLAPGVVATPYDHEAFENEEFRRRQLPRPPMERPATPEEIARLALFIVSPETEYITGTTFYMDGLEDYRARLLEEYRQAEENGAA